MKNKLSVSTKTVRTNELRPHPLNKKLYGKSGGASDPEWVELRDSIHENGILVPLMITTDNVIISGHRRWEFAKIWEIEEILTCVVSEKDEQKLERLLIHANRQRAKTTEQIAREYRRLRRIETALAKERKAHGKTAPGKTLPQNSAEALEGGDARDKAAAAVGMSHDTADKAEKVIDEIDDLKSKGKQTEADALRDTLNNESVRAAHKKVVKPQDIEKLTEDYLKSEKLRAENESLRGLQDRWGRVNKSVQEQFFNWILGQLAEQREKLESTARAAR